MGACSRGAYSMPGAYSNRYQGTLQTVFDGQFECMSVCLVLIKENRIAFLSFIWNRVKKFDFSRLK